MVLLMQACSNLCTQAVHIKRAVFYGLMDLLIAKQAVQQTSPCGDVGTRQNKLFKRVDVESIYFQYLVLALCTDRSGR